MVSDSNNSSVDERHPIDDLLQALLNCENGQTDREQRRTVTDNQYSTMTVSDGSTRLFHRFLELPLEIRDVIYRLTIGIPEDDAATTAIIIRSQQQPLLDPFQWIRQSAGIIADAAPSASRIVDPPDLNLLGVSKQIHSEAYHHFFQHNTLAFAHTNALLGFLRGIGQRRRQQITKIFFFWRGSEAKAAFRLLKTCTNLNSILFTLPCIECPGYHALREVRGLKSATVCAIMHAHPTPNSDSLERWPNRLADAHSESSRYLVQWYACTCNNPDRRYITPLSNAADLEWAMTRAPLKRKPNQHDVAVPPKHCVKMHKSEGQALQEGLHSFLNLTKKNKSTSISFPIPC